MTDQEEIIMTAQVQATEDRTDRTVREDLGKGENHQGDNRQGGRFGQGRNQGNGNRQGRPQGEGRFREITAREDVSDREDLQGDGQGRPGGRLRGDGSGPGRTSTGKTTGRWKPSEEDPQGNGQGRPDGNRSEGRDGRFGGSQGRQGQRQNTRKNDDMAFAPELTKTSKDSKREKETERTRTRKKILIRHRVADADQIRVDSIGELQNPESSAETGSAAKRGREETEVSRCN